MWQKRIQSPLAAEKSMAEIRCEFLDERHFSREADFVLRTLEERPNEVVTLTFGFGNDPDSWDPVTLRADAVRSFLDDAARRGVYDHGDVFLDLPNNEARFTLCHERDIHVISLMESWPKHFTDRWASQGISWHRRENAESDWAAFLK
jgi:hypothetical protein